MTAFVVAGWLPVSQVLLLDADNLPTKDPSYLFESPHMSSHGLMMWLDLWSPHHSSTTFIGQASVWPLLGIDRDAYLVSVLCPFCWLSWLLDVGWSGVGWVW